MAITEDTAGQPAVVPVFNNTWVTTGLTSASFSPQPGALIVAEICGNWTGGSTPTGTVISDSLGGTWTQLLSPSTAGASVSIDIEVWVRNGSGAGCAAPGAMTVTVKGGASGLAGAQLTVRSLLGAAPAAQQNGATAKLVRNTAGVMQVSLAAGTGSYVIGVGQNWAAASAMTALANTTIITSSADSGNGDEYQSFKSAAMTAGTATYGFSTSTTGAIGMVEIKPAHWQLLQKAQSGTAATGTTQAQAFASNNTAGSLLVAAVAGGASGTTFTVTDTAGNTWLPAGSAYFDSDRAVMVQLFYVPNCVAGANTVTLTLSATGLNRTLLIHEFSGGGSGISVDGYATTSSNSPTTNVTPTLTGITTTTDDDLIFAYFMIDSGSALTITGNNTYQFIEDLAGFTPSTSWMEQLTHGATTPTTTLNVAKPWSGLVAAFTPPPVSTPAPVNLKRGLTLYQNAVQRSTLL